jgi:transposase InsO family protein
MTGGVAEVLPSLKRRRGCRRHTPKPGPLRRDGAPAWGTAKRFIQTALREWAYARAYDNSAMRAAHLPRWLHDYNWHRPHGSLGYQPPVSTLGLSVNNLLGLHS